MIAHVLRLLAAAALLVVPPIAYAQKSTPSGEQRVAAVLGTYKGSYAKPGISGGQWLHHGVTLEITGIEGEKVKGKAVRTEGGTGTHLCNGSYNLEGTLKGNALALHSIGSGRVQGCAMTLQLTMDGSKLIGTVDGYSAELSR